MTEAQDVYQLKIQKVRVKTNFTNERRVLLMLLDDEDEPATRSKEQIKFGLVKLQNAVSNVMTTIFKLSEMLKIDGHSLEKLSVEAEDVEKLYAEAVTRSSTVLSYMSQYNSTKTSEITGARYSRSPSKVRAYLSSLPHGRHHVDCQSPRATQDFGDATQDLGDATQDYGDATQDYGDATQDHGDRDATQDFGDATQDYGDSTQDDGDASQDFGDSTQDFGDASDRATRLQESRPDAGDLIQESKNDPVVGSTSSASSGLQHVSQRERNAEISVKKENTHYIAQPPSSTSYTISENRTVSNVQMTAATGKSMAQTILPATAQSQFKNHQPVSFLPPPRYVAAQTKNMYPPANTTAPPVVSAQQQNVYLPVHSMATPAVPSAPSAHSQYFPINRTLTRAPRSQFSAPPMTGYNTNQMPSAPDVYRHLEQIKIPIFKGEKGTYETWKAAFTTCIHEQPMTDEVKLLRLRQCLSGAPLTTIETYGYSAAAYRAAVQRLEQKYGGQRRRAASHMDALTKVPVLHAGNGSGLEKFADLLQVIVINLQDSNQATELGRGVFYQQLLQKLSATLLSQYYRWVHEQGRVESVHTLLEWVTRESDFLTTAAETLEGSMEERVPQQQTTRPSRQQASASALTTTANPETCVFCDQPHEPFHCTVVTDVSKRKDILLRRGRCFLCLRAHHMVRHCRSNTRCSKCQRRHNTTICEGKSSAQEQPKRSARSASGPSSTTAVTAATISTSGAILLQTARAQVHAIANKEVSLSARIILDGGSQRSYITSTVSDALQLQPSGQEMLTINGFGSSENGESVERSVVALGIKCIDGSSIMVSCIAIPSICPPIQQQYPLEAVRSCKEFKRLNLADDCAGTAPVDILIGADYYWQIVSGDMLHSDTGTIALSTRLGWVLSGPVPSITAAGETMSALVTTQRHTTPSVSAEEPDDALLQQMKLFWELESLGIKMNDPSVLETFQQTIRYDGKRYVVDLPWREGHRILPDNLALCKRRLVSTLKKLNKSPAIRQEYEDVIKQQLAGGIVERVPAAEINRQDSNVVHYLPHHPVIRQDKMTTKVRVVYDASAKIGRHPSLNECLHAGPNLLERIPDILLRFRVHKVAFTADIEKAFLMVAVNETDRDALRFLWVEESSDCDNPSIIILRFARVVFGVSASPFLLNATIRHHLSQFLDSDPEFVQSLQRSLYVDDVANGGRNTAEALELFTKAKTRLAGGGFNLRKFSSNCPDLTAIINSEGPAPASPATTVVEDNESYAKSALNGSRTDMMKVLGIAWDRATDCLVMDLSYIFKDIAVNATVTKRQVLAASAKVYDPLGFLSPVTIPLKMLHQDLCAKKIGWDEPLEGEALGKWKTLIAELKKMEPVSIPRWLFSNADQEAADTITLHGFCDASKNAYAAVIYLVVTANGRVHVQQVAAKTRVAPLEKQTIPRLELLAALILARLLKMVMASVSDLLPITNIRCWTDSLVSFYWITGTQHEWKEFVERRVVQIRQSVPAFAWAYCPTESNPADLPTRGILPSNLTNSIWFTGPEWLRQSQDEPTHSVSSSVDKAAVSAELKKMPSKATALLATSSRANVAVIRHT